MVKKVFISIILIALYGCTKKNNPLSPSLGPSSTSIVAVSIALDYSEGNIGQYDLTNSTVNKNCLSQVSSDNDIRTYNGAVYILERYGKDNIIKISGSIIADSTVVYQRNIGASVNIQDIACVSETKAYITQYASTNVAIFNPATGNKSTKTIDLSAFNAYGGTDSAEKTPTMAREVYFHGKVYIACQRLKTLANGYMVPADTSLIIVINASTDSVERAIRLNYKNPQELCIFNGTLYVASVGAFGVNDAGIERINLQTNENEGIVVDEKALHGDVESIIIISDTKGYAVISTPSFATELCPYNPQTKTVGAKIAGIDSPCGNHMVCFGDYVYVGDRSAISPGIAAIDIENDTKIGTTKNIGLPPNSLTLLEIKG